MWDELFERAAAYDTDLDGIRTALRSRRDRE
jgi:hypothetical protein